MDYQADSRARRDQYFVSSEQDEVDSDGVEPAFSLLTQSAFAVLERREHDNPLEDTGDQHVARQDAQSIELTDDSVHMYLQEVGRVDLLSAGEEVVLARMIELANRLSEIKESLVDCHGSEDYQNSSTLIIQSVLPPILPVTSV